MLGCPPIVAGETPAVVVAAGARLLVWAVAVVHAAANNAAAQAVNFKYFPIPVVLSEFIEMTYRGSA
jgi:hypothetical protein